MKKAIILLLVTFPFISNCQVKFDSSILVMSTSQRWGKVFNYYKDFPTSQVVQWNDSKIDITGDTMQAIRMLVALNNYRDSEYIKMWNFVAASIDFSNNVPDYYRENNCKWPQFYKLLKEFGYHYGTKKSPQKPRK